MSRQVADSTDGCAPARPKIVVRVEDHASDAFRALTSALDAELLERYPELEGHEVVAPPNVIAAVVAYSGDTAVGCGALYRYDPKTCEISRVFVAREVRRLGAARAILQELEEQAATAGYSAVRLGTGILQPEAISLYESSGYVAIPAFGEYAGERCRCYEKSLTKGSS